MNKVKKITELEKKKMYKAICNKDRNSLANIIINLYINRGVEVPDKIHICNPLGNNDGSIFDENTSDVYNWLKNNRDRELVIINDDVYKLYYERYYNKWDDFVDYNLTMEYIGKISK